MRYHIRKSIVDDCKIILDFIRELAAYEKLEDQVIATIDDIRSTLFCDNPRAEVLILEIDNKPAGFALFFHNYSTFLCKYVIYIEDIYIQKAYRNQGYGQILFTYICQLAKQRDSGHVEWWCLDENKSAIDFYMKLGAEAMSNWTVYRLNKTQISLIADK